MARLESLGPVRLALLLWGLSTTVGIASPVHAQNPKDMPVVGYADRLGVQQGETIRFMVSSEPPRYRANIVRLIHGDPNPRGPGIKEVPIDSPVDREYPGRFQSLPNGSYIIVEDAAPLRPSESFSLQAWIAPTTPEKGVQSIVSKWSNTEREGYGLFVDEDGSLGLWLGDEGGRVEKVRTGKPLREAYPRAQKPTDFLTAQPPRTATWYFVAAAFDAKTGQVILVQEPVTEWPGDETRAVVEKKITLRSVGSSQVPLLIAAAWDEWSSGSGKPGSLFNGKIESPRLFDRALSQTEIDALRRGGPPAGAVAAWDFAADISSSVVSDVSGNDLHGVTVNRPARAMTGHGWARDEIDFRRVSEQYGAIHFHDDDLDDAKWEVAFEFRVPDDLRSGVYAARLRAGDAQDYVPFFVTPRKGAASASIALLIPTFSYLAYANSFDDETPELLSLYDHHSDGSAVFYSSRLRPILDMRPNLSVEYPWESWKYPWEFMADLHLVDWLEVKSFSYDVITDDDLHHQGAALLAPYNAVITGTHPEYYSAEMLDGLQRYLEGGGRLMYMGGNGFYWVTTLDPESQNAVEVRRWGGTQYSEAFPGEYHHSTTGEMGGLWRRRGRPPQKLVGVGFTAQGFDRGAAYRVQPDSENPRAAFIFEGVARNDLIGDFPSLVLDYGAAGSELDRVDRALGTPPHALLLATASGEFSDAYQHVVEELHDSNEGPWDELVRADMVFFEYPNGGAVWSSSSIAWCGSLSYNNYDNNVSRITENVLRRFADDEPIPAP